MRWEEVRAMAGSTLSHPGERPRVALMAVLVAAAMPIRIPVSVPLIHSVSVLDLALLAVALTLLLDCAVRPPDVGYPKLFALLCVPLGICALSMLWSQDRAATARSLLIYAEGVIAYLFVVRELAGASALRVMTYLKRYTYLVIAPALLLLLHVPGFAPEDPTLSTTSGAYLSYYTRLSHPVLGRSNSLATLLAFFVPILLFWGHQHHDRRFTCAGVVGVIAVAATLSRGVGVALLVVALLAALGSALRRREAEPRTVAKVTGVAAAIIAGMVLLYEFNPYTRQFSDARFSAANALVRWDYARAALGKIALRPLLGYGGGAVPDHDALLALGVHDTYLQQVVYYGLVLGVAACACLVGVSVFFFSRAQRTPVARVVGFTVLAQLLVFVTESSFEGTVLRVLFYLSVGMAAALLRASEPLPGVAPLPSRARREVARPSAG